MIPPSLYVLLDCETTGLAPLYGDRVTCICAKDSTGSTFAGACEDEKALINNFLNWLYARKGETLVTANGRDFDVPFIFTRAILLGIPLTDISFFLEMAHFDIQTVTKRKISLNDLGTLLVGKCKTGNGWDAIKMFEFKRFEDLKRYCMDDVCLLEDVFKAYVKLHPQPMTAVEEVKT